MKILPVVHHSLKTVSAALQRNLIHQRAARVVDSKAAVHHTSRYTKLRTVESPF